MLTKGSYILTCSKQGSPCGCLYLAIPSLNFSSSLRPECPLLCYPLPTLDLIISNFVAVIVVFFFLEETKC